MNPIARTILTVVLAVAVIGWGPQALSQNRGQVQSSLLLLIDASGSMGDEIGSGNSQVKIEAAKQAAIAALGRAAQSGSVEVAVLAFSGDCQDPVPHHQDFTGDVNRLTQFIGSLQPGGGTPMADALLFANRYMDKNGDAGASNRMIMLLADGQNDCGDIGQAMASLKSSGIIFRHETVGFGIAPNSPAAQDLRQIATQTGGAYHHAVDANQLEDTFMEFVDTFSVIDMLGTFGRGGTPAAAATRQGQPKGKPAPTTAPVPSQPSTGQVTDLLGLFKPKQPAAKIDESLEFYVAVATTVGIGQHSAGPGFRWNYATGWSADSGHDAGMEAEEACGRSSGRTCWSAGIPSMRGGCVAMVEGIWRDKDDPQEKLEVFVDTKQSRRTAESIALDECRNVIHAGKYAGTVQVYHCNLKVSYCSEDVRP